MNLPKNMRQLYLRMQNIISKNRIRAIEASKSGKSADMDFHHEIDMAILQMQTALLEMHSSAEYPERGDTSVPCCIHVISSKYLEEELNLAFAVARTQKMDMRISYDPKSHKLYTRPSDGSPRKWLDVYDATYDFENIDNEVDRAMNEISSVNWLSGFKIL